MKRRCLRCDAEITGCFGFGLARDLLANADIVREHCGRCVEWIASLGSEDMREYFLTIPWPGANKMDYPRVLTEFDTIQRAFEGASLSRFGDGELRVALGGSCVSQTSNFDLQNELCDILRGPTKSLVCIPRQGVGPKRDRWLDYARPKYVALYGQEIYGSSFVTRPDNAPMINVALYWERIPKLWEGKKVVLVIGTDFGSLRESNLRQALDVRVVWGPRRDAYMDCNRIVEEIGNHKGGPVILCLGCTATVLAERLAKKGMQALDLGHIGKFTPKEYR